MANFDVFSGGADGLCALHQYRLTYLGDANLVTGAKGDGRLLKTLKVQERQTFRAQVTLNHGATMARPFPN